MNNKVEKKKTAKSSSPKKPKETKSPSTPTIKEKNIKKGLESLMPEQVVKIRNGFYKEGSKKLKYGIITSVVLLAINSISTFIAINKNTENRYFATDENARYVELIKLDQPNHKAVVVSQWLENSLIDTFDFHYRNMRDVLNKKSQLWFTPEGRNSLITAIDEAGIFNIIEEKEFIVQLGLTQTPVLIRQEYNPASRVYEWTYQVAVRFTYTGHKSKFINNAIFTILVQRRSMLEDVKGLGISKIVMELTPN